MDGIHYAVIVTVFNLKGKSRGLETWKYLPQVCTWLHHLSRTVCEMFIVHHWTLQFCHKRCDPDSLSLLKCSLCFITGQSGTLQFPWQHQGLTPLCLWSLIRRSVTCYSFYICLHTVYVRAFTYFKSSTGHTFHMIVHEM